MRKFKLKASLALILSLGVVGSNSVFVSAQGANTPELPGESGVIVEFPKYETKMLDSDESEDSTDGANQEDFVAENKSSMEAWSPLRSRIDTDMNIVDPIRSSSAGNENKIGTYLNEIKNIDLSLKNFLRIYGGLLDNLLSDLEDIDLSEKIPKESVEFAKLLFSKDSELRDAFLVCLKSELSRFSKIQENHHEATVLLKIYLLAKETCLAEK